MLIRDNLKEISKFDSKTDFGKLFKLLKRISAYPPPKFKRKYIASARDPPQVKIKKLSSLTKSQKYFETMHNFYDKQLLS